MVENETNRLIEDFCKEVGIKKAYICLKNLDTGEKKLYASKTVKYRKPKGWYNVETTYLNKPSYPNLTAPTNFLKLLNVQWDIFGQLGDVYEKETNESFPENYLRKKLDAIKICKCFGGGEMFEVYAAALRKTNFDYGE